MAIWRFILQAVVLFASVSVCSGQNATDSPCAIATEIDGQRREVSQTPSHPDQATCDKDLQEGWYKFTLAGKPAQLPTKCLRNNICGTVLPYWLDLGEGGSLPEPDTLVHASYCTSFDVLGTVDCCVLRLPAQVYNCGNDNYVYYLQPTDRCPVAYCVYDPGQQLDPKYTTQRGQNASELTAGQSSASTTVSGDLPSKTTAGPAPSALQNTTPSATALQNTTPSATALENTTPSATAWQSTTPSVTPSVTSGTTAAHTSNNIGMGASSISTSDITSAARSTAVLDRTSSAGLTQQVPSNDTYQTEAPDSGGSSLSVDRSSVTGPDGSKTSAMVPKSTLPQTSVATPDQGLDMSGASSSEKEIQVPNNTATGVKSSLQGTTVGIFPAPSQTTGHILGKQSSMSPTNVSASVSYGSSKTPVVLSPGSSRSLITSITASSVRVNNAEPSPLVHSTSQSSETTKAILPTTAPSGTPAGRTSAQVPAQTTQAPLATASPSTPAGTVKQSHAPSSEGQTQSRAPTPVSRVTTEAGNVSSTESDQTSQKMPPSQAGETDNSRIADESVLIKTRAGRSITTEGVRSAFIKSILHRCAVGLNTAPEAVRQVILKYSLCEGPRRRKRQVSGSGLNPVITGPYLVSGEYQTHLALIKSNSTSVTVVDKDDLMTLIQDEEIKDIFLSELGVMEAKVCPNKDSCTKIATSNLTSHQHNLGEEKESSVFQAHSTLFIILIVVVSLLLVTVLVLLYMRCRSTRGSWSNDYNSMERAKLKGKGKASSAIENPATDAEIMKDEGEMREKDDILTSVNGSGPHGSYPDDDNGWVVPYDQLTMEERALPGVADTKL